ncbi:MAG TPA: hypothetical protein PLU39_01245 [Armatimonadota bacterium]|nr:hypothetical protein [Armatimonadota bacterium]HPT96470.1 hypothetical protein [Armatimonadota bacterium]
MQLREEELELATRRSVIARVLRTRFDAGAIAEEAYRCLLGRIEGARTREALDAVLAEAEKASAGAPGSG